MRDCPNCGTTSGDGDAFCRTCGSDLRTVPRSTEPAQPPKKNRAALVIGIVVGVVVLCGLCALAGTIGYLRFMPVRNVISTVTETTPTATDVESPDGGSAADADAPARGFASAEEAVKAQLPKEWQYKLAGNDGDVKEYWIGPPASEWAEAVTVEKDAGGGWSVTSTKQLAGDEGADDASADDASRQAAVDVVKRFNTLISRDEPLEAQKLTIDPFRSDAASAQYANGDFLSFTVDKVAPAGDGTWWVYVTQKWKSGTEQWKYHAVTTEAGYRINELAAP